MSDSIKVKGKIERKGFGTGTWALVSTSGDTYELHIPPKELQTAGLTVKVEGQIRTDVMTIAMIGPVLEVNHFEVLKE
ncbi:MAG: hypothetical protein KME27_00715 [Lyngbya sp. HA4199-MV5]|jgi:hypothetical protein|nr:hypothetical protein [Lyngbya sp. HA4199-MV5]